MIDYSLPHAMYAQGQGANFLSISKLDEKFKRADGKLAQYELNYRWLSCECNNENDEAYVCVLGSEFTYYQRKELDALFKQIKTGKVNLFELFNLF